MEFFPLLINGRDVDTGRYRYLPYADRAIIDPVLCMNAQRRLQKNGGQGFEDLIYAKYCICDEKDITAAINSTHEASLVFREFSFSKRVKIMNDIYELLIKEKRNLIDLMVIEGHPEQLAAWEFSGMELAYRPESMSFFKTQLRGSYCEVENETMGWVRKPDGVVCVSPPGNASCSNSLTAGFALLGGNTLIVKPPIRTPIATLYLWRNIVWESLKRNGAPSGTVSTLVGNSKTILDAWLNNPLVNDIFFFGDSRVGIEIGVRAFQANKKPILEMSGNDMLLVWKDCDLNLAIDSLLDAFLGSTQICMVPKKALIHQDIFEHFSALFVEQVNKIKVGLPSGKLTCLTPVVRIDDFFEFLEDALSKGAKILCGGRRLNYKGEIDLQGVFLEPTLLGIDHFQEAVRMKCIQEENFFPLIPLVKIVGHNDQEVFENMTKVANANKYGLRISVWVNSDFYLPRFIKKLNNSGLLRINSKHTGFSSYLSTHGGTGLSGGPFGEANYVWQKTTHLQSVSVTRFSNKLIS